MNASHRIIDAAQLGKAVEGKGGNQINCQVDQPHKGTGPETNKIDHKRHAPFFR